MDFAVFDHPRPDVDAELAVRLAADHYRILGVAEPLAGERDRSFKISGGQGEYVLKVGHLADRADALEGQSAAIMWALATDPTLPLAEVIATPSGKLTGTYQGHALQLTRFIPGLPPDPLNTTPGQRRNLGTVAARLSRALRGFDHPALHRPFPWTLAQLPHLAQLAELIASERRNLIVETMRRFSAEVAPVLGRLPGQAVHGDINNDNLVVDPDDPELITGVFDFGDMSFGPRVIEAAITAAYQCHHADPVAVMTQVVTAFHATAALDAAEVRLIPDLVAARCVQSLLMSARHVATRSDNSEYATSEEVAMWGTLVRLEEAGRGEAADVLVSACSLAPPRPRPFDDALALRQRRLGPSLRLSYDKPVRPSRGEGVWLFDEDGRRLLDAYNNVPHVGHGHPQVVAALAAQARALQTNTRYLVDGVAEYADRLVSLMPDPLSVVLFVNSGSEANDLAYRIARTVTGNRGVITSANAYHGATSTTAAMSPEEHVVGDLEPWTAQVEVREILRHSEDAARFGEELERGRGELAARGEAPAMAIFDTVFSSEGIFEFPAKSLETALSWANACGALLVADEVQAGFGRVGSRFWGFATGKTVPDIATLGKPIGNGYPMGAVVTTESIATEFAARSHFFSTFAGSPVAAAVGSAVLDVIESEELAASAEAVGAYLKTEIENLDSPDIVEVRGPGLFVGVEMRSSPLVARTVNDLRRRGILIGSTGRDEVLKIRPPLVFGRHHADLVVGALRASLAGG